MEIDFFFSFFKACKKNFKRSFFLLIFIQNSYASGVFFSLQGPGSSSITTYPGETVKIPIVLYHSYIDQNTQTLWSFVGPSNFRLEMVSGECPAILPYWGPIKAGTCILNLVGEGLTLGNTYAGSLSFTVKGRKDHNYDSPAFVPTIFVTVIPHPITMNTPEEVQAIAEQKFIFNFKKYIRFFEENTAAGVPPEAIVTPASNKGLQVDLKNYTISGRPTETGIASFSIGAKNKNGSAAPVPLTIHIGVNPAKKPRFKKQYDVPSATPDKEYELSLLSLVEKQSLIAGDQLHFAVKPQMNDSPYFKISKSDNQILTGLIPDYEAGKTLKTTIIAHSNVGGESDPFSIKIPVPFDPQLKPQIKPIHLTTEVHFNFHEELAKFIIDPTQDGTLKLIIEKIEPEAPWLHIAPLSPTEIEGIVPDDTIGQLYTLYLRANTVRGGSSDLTKATLQVKTNPRLKPRFITDKPVLPILQPGAPYEYCFTEHRNIYPEYEDYPYWVDLDKNSNNSKWIEIKNNCLRASSVPEDLEDNLLVYIKISNIPGGTSNTIKLTAPLPWLTNEIES